MLFTLSESISPPAKWPWWVLHYVFAVPVPILLTGDFGDRFWTEGLGSPSAYVRNQTLGSQELVTYGALTACALVVGFMACLLLGARSAAIARKVWIFPFSVLVLAITSDLFTFHFDWIRVVSGILIDLPSARWADMESPGLLFFGYPTVTSFSYALGWRLYQKLHQSPKSNQEGNS